MPTALIAEEQQPVAQRSQEATQDAPVKTDPNDQMLQKYGKKLIDMIAEQRNKWEWKRRGIVLKVLKNKEMLKGNQNIGFYPGSADTFDAFEQYYNFTGTDQKDGDNTMDRRPHNFYQMLEKAFVSALSAQIPKNRWLPENADVLEDRMTAKAASSVETIIERANKIKSMVRQQLMELFTAGCYFKYTRYVVDSTRTGTHKETTFKLSAAEILPPRYVCFNCGTTTPIDQMQQDSAASCPQCGAPLGPDNFFEDHVSEMPIAEQKDDVPNGMVLWDIGNPMNIDADPDAQDLDSTCLLSYQREVSVGWLRQTFDESLWDKFQQGTVSGTSSDALERQYRDMLTTPQGYSTWSSFTSQYKPTYSRVWCQPTLFAETSDRAMAKELKKQYPDGCMIAYVGELPLQIRPAKLTKEWTWCGTEQKGFGLFPNPVGDPAVPVQERINDCVNKMDEYFDRLACGILLANERYVDTRKMNGKPILPGVLNPVYTRKNAPVADIQNMIFQVRGEIDNAIFTYVSTLKQDMELLVGTPPQTFGAGTQQGVETLGGQEQQLNTGMMKMGLYWDVMREEHSEAAENAVMCAAQNMTEDWKSVVTDETKEFRNECVHLDQMKGSVHAEPETDQGFPMTYAEIKAFWEDVVQNANTQLAQWLMSEPSNVDNAIRYIGVPGLVAPGGAMKTRMLQVIEMLVNSPVPPATEADPITGQPVQIPMGVKPHDQDDTAMPAPMPVLPRKYLDDLEASQKLIKGWSQEHSDKVDENPNALPNLVAYYKLCGVYMKQLAAEAAILAGPMPGAQPAAPQTVAPASA